jgi:hypothetical protein
MMKIILKDIPQDDWILGIRAAKWLAGRVQKDALIAYGDGNDERNFYVKRNKASITVRPC